MRLLRWRRGRRAADRLRPPARAARDVPGRLLPQVRTSPRPTLASLETAGFQVENTWPIRRGSVIRRSFGYLAKETGKGRCAHLAKSRIIVGLMNWWCLLNDGKTAEMICVARKP